MQAQRPGDILIVHGDPAFLYSACVTLTQSGHEVVSCASGNEAREQLERASFDVVLCGQRLPDEDGPSFCHFIKTNPDLQRISVGLLLDAPVDRSTLSVPSVGGASPPGLPADLVSPDDFIARSVNAGELALRVRSLLRMRRYLEEIHNSIAALMATAEGVEEQDKRARGHCKRLSIMAIELGSVLGSDDWQLTALERAGYLHDIGKVSIAGALIEKETPLSPREMEIIQEHCVLGEKLCRPIAALQPVLPIIRHHHERIDGSGYPDGLQGNAIPILAQIFSIVDIYDALRMWRPYRPPMHESQAIQIIQQEVDQGLWNHRIFVAFVEYVLPGLDNRLDSSHVLWPKS